ncbi:tripartite tricarboxylate transporter TctB family protein [Halopenitus persicus]|uniref:Tripartite tricarboxylate transporter TctB family protein n=1 Tax=Halopenitus persicus TaxID=1048396 RepID=A0A1H3H786_9EURY|nr:tripartite tricarboxylate transporter TctB family protein [Halopenitus persicus]QHS16085.1 hypothetical protein GWK26_02365 [haloarchaeon 3A1-DGR]SDY11200.1 Tripartite tricarboxylate transporter TctB family protein [Halopenitus persicus]
MTAQELYRRLVEDVIDAEKLLVAMMVVSSGYMLWGTTQFSIDRAARFPRLVASVVFIGSLLLLFQAYLPAVLRNALLSEGAAFEASDEFTEKESEIEEPTAETESEEISSVGRPIHDSVFTAISVVGYGLVGYAIGLLWASPLFVLLYARWFRIDLLRTVILAVIGFGIAYSFMIVLTVPMDGGALLFQDGVSWLPR